MSFSTAQHRLRRGRRGLATVEFALCLPLLVAIFLGTLDTCQVVFLQQSMDAACYEGQLLAASGRATTAQVLARCEEMLAAGGVQGVRISTEPVEVAAAPPGATVTVRMEADCAEQTFFGPFHRSTMLNSHFVTPMRRRWDRQEWASELPASVSLDPALLDTAVPLPGGVL